MLLFKINSDIKIEKIDDNYIFIHVRINKHDNNTIKFKLNKRNIEKLLGICCYIL